MKKNFQEGFLIGFAVASIVWCVLWSLVIAEIDENHKKEVDYLIEKKLQE